MGNDPFRPSGIDPRTWSHRLQALSNKEEAADNPWQRRVKLKAAKEAAVRAEQVVFFEEEGQKPKDEPSVKPEVEDVVHLVGETQANRRRPNKAFGNWHFIPRQLLLTRVPGAEVVLKPPLDIEMLGMDKDKQCFSVKPWKQVLKLSLTPLGDGSP